VVITGNRYTLAAVNLLVIIMKQAAFRYLLYAFTVLQREYESVCTSTDMCKTGLTCSTSGFQCNCPSLLPAGRCDCDVTKYYHETNGCGE
jgi:hypothetical protein